MVDFGCGSGLARAQFWGANYIGIDQNPDMIEACKTRWLARDPDLQVYQTPLNTILDNYPELEGIGDIGVFITVLQHNHWEVAREILEQTYRVLKPGALLTLSEGTYIDKYFSLEIRRQYSLPDVIDPL